MFTDDDTIAAISTPVEEGGIGIVRLIEDKPRKNILPDTECSTTANNEFSGSPLE